MTGPGSRAAEPLRGADEGHRADREEDQDEPTAASELGSTVGDDEPDASLSPPEPAAEPPPSVQEQRELERRKLRAALEDLEAAKSRVQRDGERALERMRGELVAKLLPVLDNLELSLAAGQTAAEPEFVAGLRLVRDQLEEVLTGYGLERIDAVGQPFDPEIHEAVGIAPTPHEQDEGRVVRQWQPGYRFGDRVLRAAKVVVARRDAG